MSWSPILGSMFQYDKEAAAGSGPASGYVLKLYSASNVAIQMASAKDGSGLLDDCVLDSSGYPLNGSAARFTPFIDQEYKVALYSTQALADANTTASADFFIGPFDPVNNATSSIYNQGSTGAADRTVEDRLQVNIYTSDFGTDNTAFANALTAAANGRLTVDNSVTITGAHTVATTVELEVKKEGLIIDGTGGTMQINGGFICDFKNQAFSGFAQGDIVFDTGGYSNAVERMGYPEWWGIDGTNDEVEINNCIRACRNTILTGQYSIGAAVTVPYDTAISRSISGLNRQATLLAATTNITVLHWSGTYGFCEGITINGNGQAGTIGLKVATEADVDDKNDATWQATVENQNNNVFKDMRFTSIESGVVLACGPNVGGQDSGLYHNKFYNFEFFDCTTRAILYRDMTSGSDPAVGSGSNSNHWISPRFLGTIATGIDIQSGGGNMFDVPHFENITKSINVANTQTNTGECPRNCFRYAHEENITSPSTVSNVSTIFFLHDLNISGSINTEVPIDIRSGQNGQFFLGGIRSLAESEMLRLDNSGNLMMQGITSPATNATNTLHMPIGVASASNITDGAQMLVKDIGGAAGQASYHIKNEQGTEGVVTNCVYKTTTGDPSPAYETLMAVNTFDNTVKIYADGAWRTLASGW